MKCTALDLDIFPASELDKTSRARMCRHRDGSPVQSSASTQMPEPRNRSGKDYAAMTGAELDVIKVACQQIGLGSAGSGKERDRGALVMNLFAAHALMVRVISKLLALSPLSCELEHTSISLLFPF